MGVGGAKSIPGLVSIDMFSGSLVSRRSAASVRPWVLAVR